MHPENHLPADESAQSLEARLRALPLPPVPEDLEARLVAAIPAQRRRWRPLLLGGAVATAAGLIIALVWRWHTVDTAVTLPRASQPTRSADLLAAQAPLRPGLDANQVGTFTWPLEEARPLRVSMSIPSDLLQ